MENSPIQPPKHFLKTVMGLVGNFVRRHPRFFAGLSFWILWIGVALMVRIFLFQPFNIPSGSMIPTLWVGDHLFVSKYSYGYSRYALPFQSGEVRRRFFAAVPERGDVVIFRLPRDTDQDYIKRVIGLPGDEVQVREGRLYLNGRAVDRVLVGERVWRETLPNGRSYLTLDLEPNGMVDNTPIYRVPEGHIFVMGDNRDNSTDSRFTREVGFIPMRNLVGRARIIYFSIGEAGSVPFFGAVRWDRLGHFIQ